MKKTKIVCSIGPSSNEVSVMEQMVRNGMNIARINCSHATLEEKEKAVVSVKEVRERTGANIAIMYDLKGPEFRSGMLGNDQINLIDGNTIRIVKENILGTENEFSVNHPGAIDSLNIGDIVLLQNGLMKIEVVSKEDDGVTCKIINGGVLGNKKSLSAPAVKLDIPYISEQDREDTIYACSHEADFLAISFVESKENVLEIREILKSCGREKLPIICKIENQLGVDNLREILSVSEGIMVARGDLGTETALERIPFMQKEMIKTCREMNKICIVATEMLKSMEKSARPTRAEVSDIANAILDGTDAVMLSEESTIGKYPIETVTYMGNICAEAELHYDEYKTNFVINKELNLVEITAKSIVTAAELTKAKAIVIKTISGYSATVISNLKPDALIIAIVTNEEVRRSLALNAAVYPIVINDFNSIEEVINTSREKAIEMLNLTKGDKIVIASGFNTATPDKFDNLMKIEEI